MPRAAALEKIKIYFSRTHDDPFDFCLRQIWFLIVELRIIPKDPVERVISKILHL